MKIKAFTVFLLIGFSITLHSCAQLSCEKFKTGKFVLMDNEKKLEYIIERNDSIQTETNLKTGMISKYRINWINECNYELKIIEGRKELMDFYNGRKLVINIIELFEDGYKFSAKLEGNDQIRYQTVKRID